MPEGLRRQQNLRLQSRTSMAPTRDPPISLHSQAALLMHAWQRTWGCLTADLTCLALAGSGRGKGFHRLGGCEAAVALLQQRLVPTTRLHDERASGVR